MRQVLRNFNDYIVELISDFFILGLICIILGIGFLAYYDITQPSFTLKKTEWTCIENKIVNSYKTIVTSKGDSAVVPTVETICIKFERNVK